MSETCVCGDDIDEHGHDPEFPGSTACQVEDCGCVAFEADGDDGPTTKGARPDER